MIFSLLASLEILGNLLQIWIGWNVLPKVFDIEVLESSFFKSSTCFTQLKIPGHYSVYATFERDLPAAIRTAESGFRLCNSFS